MVRTLPPPPRFLRSDFYPLPDLYRIRDLRRLADGICRRLAELESYEGRYSREIQQERDFLLATEKEIRRRERRLFLLEFDLF